MITRRDLIVALVATCATVTAVVWADAPGKRVMKSSVFAWDSLKAEAKPTGARRAVFDMPTATLDRFECHVTTINPGQMPHAGHHHPEEELIIVREGTIEAGQNSTANSVGPGGIIFEASNEYHSLRNIGQTPATYYVIKWVPHGVAENPMK
ncbi:MAG TPA: cupin domain-containing protein [Verrucomicrobiae bacterium]|nr:cupin domain-containing protein [Verrucomicrobiae bacterium]